MEIMHKQFEQDITPEKQQRYNQKLMKEHEAAVCPFAVPSLNLPHLPATKITNL